MADKEAQAKPKTVVAVPAPVAVKPKTVVAPAPVVAISVYTAPAVNTVQAAIPLKIKTTNPVVGKAKY